MNRIIYIVSLLILFSCSKKQETDDNLLGSNYYPIETGRWVIYDAYLKKYTGSGNYIDSTYQIKEVTKETITVDDETRYKLYVYYRKDASEDWKSYPDSVWTHYNDLKSIVRVENNIRLAKLSLPLENNKTWDCNFSNTYDEKICTMKNVGSEFTIDNKTYSNTVYVQLQNNVNLAVRDIQQEVYAEGIGMVYKEYTNYKYDDTDLLAQLIDVGTYLKVTLNSYGK